MEFIIEPYKGIGEILIGMTSQQIEDSLSVKPRKFKKFEGDIYETDAYDMFYVYYNSTGFCEAIELFKPAIVTFNRVNLMQKPYNEVKQLFLSLDENTECDDSGLTSLKFGIGIYTPFATDEPLKPAESVIIFEKGYYTKNE